MKKKMLAVLYLIAWLLIHCSVTCSILVHQANSISLYCICLDLPQEFSSENLGDPEISFIPDEEQVDVTLLCSVKVLNGIENWRNVSYKIEWFTEGKSLQSESLDEEEICGGLPNGAINGIPCPGEAGELVSRLQGTKYKIGQYVR